MGEIKRLHRSRSEKRLAGVCGGIGLFLGIDPVIVRLIWIILSLFTWIIPGLLAYVLAWIIVPEEPVHSSPAAAAADPATEGRF